MKKTFIILGAAALILFQACQKEEAANGTAGDKQEVSANIILNAAIEGAAEEGTKTTLDEVEGHQYAVWSSGDAVCAFNESGSVPVKMDIVEPVKSKQTKAAFFAEVPEDWEPVCAFYPASEGFNPGYADNVISFNLPATQYYKVNSFDDNTNVAVSKIQNDEGKLNAKFMNVCGYLKLQLKGNFKVGKITVSGHNGEKLNGAFTVNTDVAEENMVAQATSTRTAGDDVITLDCTANGGVQLNTETATTFYIVVPVDAFKDPDGEGNKIGGFTAVIYDVTNANAPEFTVLATEKDNTIHRSKIKAMPKMTFDDDTPKFKEVEYLQSADDGRTQIINTNYYTKKTVGIFINFKINTKFSGVQCIMGSFISGDKLSIVKSTDYDNRFNLYFGNDDTDGYVEGEWSKPHKIRVENNYGYIDDKKGKKINSKTIKISGENQLYLFGSATSTTGSGTAGLKGGYVYSAYITDEGVKVRDFIPCCCVSGKYTDGDGNKPAEAVTTAKPGMFDLVSGRLFINKGTSTDFTPGPYVN